MLNDWHILLQDTSDNIVDLACVSYTWKLADKKNKAHAYRVARYCERMRPYGSLLIASNNNKKGELKVIRP